MPIDPKTGKEVLCYVVDLKQASPEYKEVEQAFSRTMGVAGSFPSRMLTPYQGIVKIQRIQNQKLYSQYIARKRVIDKANPEGHKNEETLFHSCDGGVTNDINDEGLNTNFAGKNGEFVKQSTSSIVTIAMNFLYICAVTFYYFMSSATALGRGVYFARDACFSASDTYTPRDANGHKHMYYARVLTGQYTKGNSSLATGAATKGSQQPISAARICCRQCAEPTYLCSFSGCSCVPRVSHHIPLGHTTLCNAIILLC